jgi:hypothetical protein
MTVDTISNRIAMIEYLRMYFAYRHDHGTFSGSTKNEIVKSKRSPPKITESWKRKGHRIGKSVEKVKTFSENVKKYILIINASNTRMPTNNPHIGKDKFR